MVHKWLVKKPRRLLIIGLILFSVIICISVAAYWLYFTNQNLTSLSTHIVIGEVENIECSWNEEKTSIWTYVTLSVEQYLKGNGTSTISIRTRGGEVDGLVQWVSSEATFGFGERVKVFLVKDGSNFFVVRGAEGKVKLNE